MTKSGLSHSARKFIRKEKARIRQEILDKEEAEKKIREFVKKLFEKYRFTHRGFSDKLL